MNDQKGSYDFGKVPSVQPPDETPQPDVPKILSRQLSIVQSDTISGNVSTVAHGWMPKLTGTATQFIDGTGAYDTIKDSDLSLSDITTNNASTSNHGFLRKLTGSTSNFLRADGTWAAPGGSLTRNIVAATRGATTASGDQTIAHGLGTTPTYVQCFATNFGTTGQSVCFGVFDGTDYTLAGIDDSNENYGAGSTEFLRLEDGAGNVSQTCTIAVDATNITLTWTKTGSPTGTIRMAFTCFA